MLRINLPFTLLLLAAAFIASSTVLSLTQPGFSLKGNSRVGIPIMALAISTYIFGSYLGSFEFRWSSAFLLYFGMVLYLGGRTLALAITPGLLNMVALAFISLLGESYLIALANLAVGEVAVSIFLAWSVRNEKLAPKCRFCGRYEASEKGFCYYCGRMLGELSLHLSRGRLIGTVVLSAVLILASLPVFNVLAVSPSGINYATYTISGFRDQTVLPALNGWRVIHSRSSSNASVTSGEYVMKDTAGAVVNLTVAFAGQYYTAFGAVLSHAPEAIQNGVLQVGTNMSLPTYKWKSSSNSTLFGVLWPTTPPSQINARRSSPINLVAGRNVTAGTIVYMVSENSANFNSTGGRGFFALLNGVNGRVENSIAFNSLLRYIVALGAYTTYFGAGAAIAVIVVIVGVFRSLEIEKSKRSENGLALDPKAFSLLSYISSDHKPRVGAEILAEYGSRSGFRSWDTLHEELTRLKDLGLVETKVKTRRGVPFLTWRPLVG